MKARFKVEHFTEEEVIDAVHFNTVIEACDKLGIIPEYKLMPRGFEINTAIRRLYLLMIHFKILKKRKKSKKKFGIVKKIYI